MNLHVETQGSGEPLLLIHGWGMHGGMWQQVAGKLAETHTVHSVDLPGHGLSKLPSPACGRGVGGGELEAIVTQLMAQFSEPLTLCGWSLGGQVALRWAQRNPTQVKSLILVATTPCFVQQQDWSCAMAPDTLQEFARALLQNHAQTLKRFLALQVRGSENEKEILGALREQLFAKGEPELAALQAGLDILRDADLRAGLTAIKQAALIIAGERDMLTPAGASEFLVQQMPNAQLAVIKGAAHAPFLSHWNEFLCAVRGFLNNKNTCPQITQIHTDY